MCVRKLVWYEVRSITIFRFPCRATLPLLSHEDLQMYARREASLSSRAYLCFSRERVRIATLDAVLHAPLLRSLPLVVALLLPSSLPLCASILEVGHERSGDIPRGEGNYC